MSSLAERYSIIKHHLIMNENFELQRITVYIQNPLDNTDILFKKIYAFFIRSPTTFPQQGILTAHIQGLKYENK